MVKQGKDEADSSRQQFSRGMEVTVRVVRPTMVGLVAMRVRCPTRGAGARCPALEARVVRKASGMSVM